MGKLLMAALLIALPACTMPLASVPPPATIADQTILDEQTGLSVELAYQAAATAVKTADQAGIIPAAAKLRIAAADRRAYAAVRAVRGAYDAQNAASYATALPIARAAVADLLSSIGSN